MVITKKYDWEQKIPDLRRSDATFFIIPEQTWIIEKDVKFSMFLSWRYPLYASCTHRFQIKPIEGVNISSVVLEYSMNSPNGKMKGAISKLKYDKEKNIHYLTENDYDKQTNQGERFFSFFSEENSKYGTIFSNS